MSHVPVHDGHLFTWSKDPRSTCKALGTTDASDLTVRFCSCLWNDACDVGFFIKGKAETILFIFAGEHREDGELVYTEWASPFGGYRVRIFND